MTVVKMENCPCYGYKKGTTTRCSCNCNGCQAIAGCNVKTADAKKCSRCR